MFWIERQGRENFLSILFAQVCSYALAGAIDKVWGPRGILVVLGGMSPVAGAIFVWSIPRFRDYVIDLRATKR